jgi:hypothetical protein
MQISARLRKKMVQPKKPKLTPSDLILQTIASLNAPKAATHQISTADTQPNPYLQHQDDTIPGNLFRIRMIAFLSRLDIFTQFYYYFLLAFTFLQILLITFSLSIYNIMQFLHMLL